MGTGTPAANPTGRRSPTYLIAADADVRGSLLRTDEKTEGMSGRVSEHIQRLTVVAGAVVQQGGPEFFGALPLTLQFLDAGHTEVVMHLLRYIVRGARSVARGPGPPGKRTRGVPSGRAGPASPSHRSLAIGGDLIAGAVAEAEELPVELRETAAVGGVESGVHQKGVGGHLGPPAPASGHRHLSTDLRLRNHAPLRGAAVGRENWVPSRGRRGAGRCRPGSLHRTDRVSAAVAALRPAMLSGEPYFEPTRTLTCLTGFHPCDCELG